MTPATPQPMHTYYTHNTTLSIPGYDGFGLQPNLVSKKGFFGGDTFM